MFVSGKKGKIDYEVFRYVPEYHQNKGTEIIENNSIEEIADMESALDNDSDQHLYFWYNPRSGRILQDDIPDNEFNALSETIEDALIFLEYQNSRRDITNEISDIYLMKVDDVEFVEEAESFLDPVRYE